MTVLPLCRTRHNGKRVNGRKRHIAVDTGGLLLVVLVTVAGIQDRDAWLCQPEVDLDLAYIS